MKKIKNSQPQTKFPGSYKKRVYSTNLIFHVWFQVKSNMRELSTLVCDVFLDRTFFLSRSRAVLETLIIIKR